MLLAENKYKNLKQGGEWGDLSDAEAEIVALNAKIDVLKQKGTKNLKEKPERKKRNSKMITRRKRRKKRKKHTFIGKNPEPTNEENSGWERLLLVSQSPELTNQRMGTMGLA